MLSPFHRIPERNGRTDRQTDRFAISISRVTQGHWKWHHSKVWYGFLFAFCSNYGCVVSLLGDFSVKNGLTLKTGLELLKIIENGAVRS